MRPISPGTSRTLKDTEKSAGAVENIVAIDGIAVIIDKSNTVSDLTKDQLIRIYKGEICRTIQNSMRGLTWLRKSAR